MKNQHLKDIYDQYTVPLKEQEVVKGRIVKILKNNVLVDLGLKSEGILSIDEFTDPDELVEGKEIYVYLEKLESKDGSPIISKRQADFQLRWDTIKEKEEKGESVEAKVKKRVKGGLMVEIFGLEAFLPGSQIDIKPVPNHDELLGQTFLVKIINVNYPKQNIVVSRRQLLEEEMAARRAETLKRLKVGDVVWATVKALTEFGAFVDIDGIDALLHISDLSWDKIFHPGEVLSVDSKVRVKVLTIDQDSGRVTVGIKQLTSHPWDRIEEKYPIGSKVKGRVTTLAEYGAFVELEKNIEGLIHVSEMSWTKTIHHPSQLLKINDEVEVVVLNIDKENRRISLGLKQTQPDPWSIIEEKYKIGEKVSCKVNAYKMFGAFVEIEEGVEGLIPVNELSWTKKIRHPREVLKRGQRVEAVILDIDKINRHITLSLKRLKEDPLMLFAKEYKEDDVLKVTIVDIPKAGLVVKLPFNLEGFIPQSMIALDKDRKKVIHQIGEEIEAKIIKIEQDKRRVVLSERALTAQPLSERKTPVEKEERAVSFRSRSRRFTISDRIKKKMPKEKKEK